MGLPPGTVTAWSEREAFRSMVAMARTNRLASEQADIDLGRLLTPSHRPAAELTVEGMKQADIARELRVHRQPIRNWSKLPAFSPTSASSRSLGEKRSGWSVRRKKSCGRGGSAPWRAGAGTPWRRR
jgi:hypothetical protein